MDFSKEFIEEINKKFSYTETLPIPCAVICLEDNCIVKANDLMRKMLKLSFIPSSLENFTDSDFEAMISAFPNKESDALRTNTEMIKITDSEGNDINANIDIKTEKCGDKTMALTLFEALPPHINDDIEDMHMSFTQIYEFISHIFDEIPILAYIPDNLHNDFVYTNKYTDDIFSKTETGENKLLSFAETNKDIIDGEELQISGISFLMYSTKLNVRPNKELNFVIGIENSPQKGHSAHKHAGIDSISGAYNSAYAIMGLESLIFKAEIDSSIFSVCYVDINRLNEVNVKYGNIAGDDMLKELVELMKSNTRKSDFIARMESDEFILILPNCGAVTASKIMKNISDRMYDELILNYSLPNYIITYGIFECDKYSKMSASEIIKAAREQMLKNKELF